MTSSPEPPAISTQPVGLGRRLRRFLYAFGSGDPVAAAFTLGGFVLLCLALLGYLVLFAIGLVSLPAIAALAPNGVLAVFKGLQMLAFVSLLLGALRAVGHFHPWWTRIFPTVGMITGTLFALCALLLTPPRRNMPFKQTLSAASDIFLNVALVSALIALLVGLVARLLQWRLRQAT